MDTDGLYMTLKSGFSTSLARTFPANLRFGRSGPEALGFEGFAIGL